jgi:ketopantoate reductase
MRIVVIGAGAIGGFVGGKLAVSGQDVTFVDRQPFVEAVRANGLRIIEPDKTTALQVKAVTELGEAFDGPCPPISCSCASRPSTPRLDDDLRPFSRASA